LLRTAETRLAPASGSASLDAAVLLCHSLGVERAHLFAHPHRTVASHVAEAYRQLVEQRALGRPVAHLTGRQEFWSLLFHVNEYTLVPRADTEVLVEQALARIPRGLHRRVLDLGTGSGIVAVSIAHERSAAEVTATDACARALAVAAANAARLTPGRVEFRMGDWFEAVRERRFDVVVSNPPYIGANEPELSTPALSHEPKRALVSDRDGLGDVATIVKGAPDHMEAGGWLLLEHGYRQGKAVRQLMREAGFGEIVTVNDLAGHERVTLGQC